MTNLQQCHAHSACPEAGGPEGFWDLSYCPQENSSAHLPAELQGYSATSLWPGDDTLAGRPGSCRPASQTPPGRRRAAWTEGLSALSHSDASGCLVSGPEGPGRLWGPSPQATEGPQRPEEPDLKPNYQQVAAPWEPGSPHPRLCKETCLGSLIRQLIFYSKFFKSDPYILYTYYFITNQVSVNTFSCKKKKTNKN